MNNKPFILTKYDKENILFMTDDMKNIFYQFDVNNDEIYNSTENTLHSKIYDIIKKNITNHKSKDYRITYQYIASKNKTMNKPEELNKELITLTYKNQISSLLLIMKPMTNKVSRLLFTDIDFEQYKYKEFNNDSYFHIIKPNDYYIIDYDFTKCFITFGEMNYLKIDIYDSGEKIDIYDSGEKIDILYSNNLINEEYKINPEVKIVSLDFLNDLLYKNNEIINDIVSNFVVFTNYKENTYKHLLEHYGNIIDDIKNVLVNDIILKPDNRFYKKYIYPTFLSKDICYWIINESENKSKQIGGWVMNETYTNYKMIMSLDILPSILNFMMFKLHYFMNHIKEHYSMNLIDINVHEIFVVKYMEQEKDNSLSFTNDKLFLTMNIQLNDIVDFDGGCIMFENDEPFILQQGDLLMYNKKLKRTNGNVTMGVRYVLVIMLELMNIKEIDLV